MKRSVVYLSLFSVAVVVSGVAWWMGLDKGYSSTGKGVGGMQEGAPTQNRTIRRSSADRAASPRFRDFEDVPPGRALDVAESLGAAARNGDANAAFQIYAKLSRCFDSSSNEVTEQIRAAYRRVGISDEAIDEEVALQRTDCQGAGELVASRGQWLELAAERGYAEGMIMYAADPAAILGDVPIFEVSDERLSNYIERSLNYMDGLVEQGDANAMILLSMLYKSSDLIPSDKVLSAAYRMAAERVAPLDVPVKPTHFTMDGLTSTQEAEARAIAQQIQSKCCEP